LLSSVCVIGSYIGDPDDVPPTPDDCTGFATDKFTVNVYEDDPVSQALPGALKCTSATTIFAKGIEFTDSIQFTRHQLTLTTPCPNLVNGTKYWVEIFNDTVNATGGDDRCNYYWLNAAQGQGNNYAMQDLSASYGSEDAVAPPFGSPDMSWCLNLRNHAPPEPIRACCSCLSSGQCDSQTGDPCCKDASFYECNIEKKAEWIFSQTQCLGFTCPQVNAPSNDECSGALTVTGGVTTINNKCATDTPPPLDSLSCEDNPTPFRQDVWYKYISTCEGDLSVDMCDFINNQDTVMAIYGDGTATCPCPVTQPNQIGDCNDDGCFWGGTGPSLVIPAATNKPGDCYMIRIAGFFDDDGAEFDNTKLEIACAAVTAPNPLTKGADDKCIGGTNAGLACAQHLDCPGGFCQLKNRFITGVVSATATSHGLKVTLVSLDANSVATPANYNGTDRWVGAPAVDVSDGTSPKFNAAKLQCGFESFDWNALLTGSIGAMQLHIYGGVVVPGSVYDVSSCNPQASCSATLRIGTAKWGDIIAPLNVTNFQDIVAVVNKFGGIQLPPAAPSKTRTKLSEPVNPSTLVNFQDIAANVAAFQGTAYKVKFPAAPATCP
jgi:hypothetical protein